MEEIGQPTVEDVVERLSACTGRDRDLDARVTVAYFRKNGWEYALLPDRKASRDGMVYTEYGPYVNDDPMGFGLAVARDSTSTAELRVAAVAHLLAPPWSDAERREREEEMAERY